MNLKQIVYCSELHPDYQVSEVYKILKTARTKNPSIGVTGYLVYGSRYFMQIIEGPEASIKGLFKKIEQDQRHKEIKVIEECSIKQIEYESWAMGFANLTENLHPMLKNLLDEIGLLGDFNPYVLNQQKAKKVLKLFAKNSEFLKD